MKVLIVALSAFFSISFLNAQGLVTEDNTKQEKEFQEKVESSVLNWAANTLDEFDGPRFEKFRADYTDEYTMAQLRIKSLDDNIARLKKQKQKGTYNGSEEDYRKAMEVLLERKNEAEEKLIDFHPKVKNYTIHFWANVRLDSGVQNYVEFQMIVDDYFSVTQHEVISMIGDNKNAKIVYKTK